MNIDAAHDYIELPKGSLPRGPVQTSRGDWVIVMPVISTAAIEEIQRGHQALVEAMRELTSTLAITAMSKRDL